MKLTKIGTFFTLFVLAAPWGCGPKAFTKGEYDDPNRVELLDDKFNENDMQQMSQTVVNAVVNCSSIKMARIPPVVIVEGVKNATEEHIDTVALTDMIRTNLIKSKKVRFVNKEARENLEEEYKYNESGNVREDKKKKRGQQTGADHILSGRMASRIQEMGGDKFVYYKLTMNLTNLESSEIDCVEEREIRKKFEKKRIGA